jgi:hypothetical protein
VSKEGYFEFLIAGYLNLQYPVYSMDGEVIGVWVGWFSLWITLFLFPYVWFKIIMTPLDKFSDPNV